MKDINAAIRDLKKLHEQACKKDFVRNPLAYALFHTWKKYDNEDKSNETVQTVPDQQGRKKAKTVPLLWR